MQKTVEASKFTSNSFDRVPPYSIEAEMAVLGSMLLDSQAMETAIEILKDETPFYQPHHRQLFAIMKSLVDGDRAVDIVTLTNELRTREVLSTIGGAEYLTEL